MRAVRILCAIVLLGIGVGGGIVLARSSQALRIMLVQGRPVVCPYRDSFFTLPSRPVAMLIMGTPALAMAVGSWLLVRSLLERS